MDAPEIRFEENMGLVYFILKRYFAALSCDPDLIQEGMIGLWKACLTYDEDRAKFVTYASTCIQNSVRMSLRKRKKHAGAISLDAPWDDGEGHTCTPADLLEDKTASAFDDGVQVTDFIQRLDAYDRRIVELRLAGMPQADVAQRLGISQCHVSRRLNALKKEYETGKRKAHRGRKRGGEAGCLM